MENGREWKKKGDDGRRRNKEGRVSKKSANDLELLMPPTDRRRGYVVCVSNKSICELDVHKLG